MPELIEDQNDQIAKRLSDEEAGEIADHIEELMSGTIPAGKLSAIASKAAEVAIKESGLDSMFKPKSEWEQEQRTFSQAGLTTPAIPLETVKKNRAKSKAPQVGKVDAQSLVEKMQEQIKVILQIATVTVEIDNAGLSPKAREVLIQLQKSVETAKEVAIQSIQQI